MKSIVMGAVALALTGVASASANISVFVNGNAVRFPVGQPMEHKGHVMVPLRGVFEEMGGTVQWDQAAQMVTVAKGDITIKMTVGEAHALKNEETIVTQVRSMLRGGTVYVPLRFLAETLDAKVQWVGDSRTVQITTTEAVPSPSSQRKPPPPQA